MNLGTSFVELTIHGVVHKIPWKPGCLTLITLLLLHPRDKQDLGNDDAPEDAPDGQNAFERVGLD